MLIDDSRLNRLSGDRRNREVEIALLFWVIDRLKVELEAELRGKELVVVPCNYMGAYPAIGLHYGTSPPEADLEPKVVEAIDRLLDGATVGDFVAYMTDHPSNWRALVDEHFGEMDPSRSESLPPGALR